MNSPLRDLQPEETYSMRVVCRATGLTPDTIRAWERRYAAIEPDRTAGNTRRYSPSDIRRLTLLREATQRGHTISAIANLHEDALRVLLSRDLSPPSSPTYPLPPEATAQPSPSPPSIPSPSIPSPASTSLTSTSPSSPMDAFVQTYLSSILRFEARSANEMLTKAATLMDPYAFVFSVVIPVLQEVGSRWSHAEFGISQEHLVSTQMRSILFSMLRLSTPSTPTPPRRVLITTPQTHLHEFGILVGAFLCLSRGFEVIYLGPDLPDSELSWSVNMSRADLLLIGISRDIPLPEASRLALTLDTLSQRLHVWVGSPLHHCLTQHTQNIQYFHSFEALDAALAAFPPPAPPPPHL